MGSTTKYDTKYKWHELTTGAHAWQLFLNKISPIALQERCLSWLSVEERAYYEKLRTERLRHDYLAARALCRAALSWYTTVDPSDWIFGSSLHGKPKIIAPGEFKSLQFNVAHTNALVICLVSRVGEVGVDAEETSRVVNVAQVARHFLSRREESRLQNLPVQQRLDRFFEQWVLREAYLKGIGKGITTALERLTFEVGENGQPKPIRNWQLFLHWPSAKHVAAAAIRQRHGAGRVSLIWLRAYDLFEEWLPSQANEP